MLHSKTYLTSLRVFLLLLFISYYSNSSFFYHTHVIDGKLVTHSHFFTNFSESQDQPVKSHSHSSEENTLIESFDQSNFVDSLEFIQLTTPRLLTSSIESEFSLPELQESKNSNKSLRAPPQA